MRQSSFFERQAQMGVLETAFSEARAGSSNIVLVSGEAGIGKTTLVEKFAANRDDDARVLRGYCDPLLTPSALGPVFDIWNSLGGEPNAFWEERLPMQLVYSRFLAKIHAMSVPALIVVEDIHWSDAATLDLLKYASRRLDGARALLVATYRDADAQRHEPLRVFLGDLASSRLPVRRIPLSPLSKFAVADMARGHNLDVDALYRQTGGNPFFVSEVIADPKSGVPLSVRDAVLGRAARLGEGGRRLLEIAAVIGARIELRLFETVAGDSLVGLPDCLASGLLHVADRYLIFRHELARNAVLEAIDPLRQRQMFRDVLAGAIACGYEDGGHFAQLAHYAEGASLSEQVVRYGRAAAGAARAVGAHREAAAHYASVLRFSSNHSPEDVADYLMAYARECALVDNLSEASHAYSRAVDLWAGLGNAMRQGEALSALAWPLVRNGNNSAAERAIENAVNLLEPLGETKDLAQAFRTQAHLRMLDRDRDNAVAIGLKACAIAARLGEREILAGAEMVVGAAKLVFDDQDGLIHLERSRAIATADGLEDIVALIQVNIGSSFGEQYHFTEAKLELEKGLQFAVEHDLDHSANYLLAWLALTDLFLGNWNNAAEASTKLISGPNVASVSRIMALVALGRVRTRRGDPGAQDVLDEALELASRTETLQRLAPVCAARAELAWFSGDHDGVMRETETVFDLAWQRRHAWHVGELLYWRKLAGASVESTDWIATPYALQLEGRWQEAQAAWLDRSCPYERARALAQGDEANKLTALKMFDELGAAPAAALLRRTLRATGDLHVPRGPRQSTRANPFGLTAREVTILGHLANGLTNAKVAEILFISNKTVDHHVSSILSKIGARSRAEAAETAVAIGIAGKNG